jgi:large subunit ribosomal protein L28
MRAALLYSWQSVETEFAAHHQEILVQDGPNEREITMSRRCELTGTGPIVGNIVSHSNTKTKRRYLPNLQDVTLASDSLGRAFRLRITMATLRSVDHNGGLDGYIVKIDETKMSDRARKIRKEVKAKLAALAAA